VRIATANDACTPSPRIDSLTLRAGLVRRVAKGAKGRGTKRRPQARRKLRVSRSRGSRVRGRLVGATGEPLGGATVCVVGRQDRTNAGLVKYGTVVTDPEGRFTFDIPGGPSRRVSAVHRVPGGAVVADMRLMVPARIALRPSRRVLRNGQAVVLKGRLRDGPHPRRPLLVELQSRRSSGWQTFGTTTARGGRFKFRYRFTRTSGVQRYQLRARVARQAVYPYAPGASKPVTLEVRGWWPS